MGKKPLIRIEEHDGERVASFRVHCSGPEGTAWVKLRSWVMENIKDCKARRYIGCAPRGHHPEGEAHDPNEGDGFHEYQAQMLLFGDEGRGDSFFGAEVCDAPKGLFLVGDVVLNEYNDAGQIDIGTSMQKAYGVMAACLAEMGGYEFQLGERPYYEEHEFTDEWFQGEGDLAGFRLWVPIRKLS